MLFGKKEKKPSKLSYDKENQKPVIRASICNGEQVAGFRDIHTGEFSEVMFLANKNDLEIFLHRYGIEPEEITKEY